MMLREELAALAHEQWARWTEHLFSKGTFNEDGTWTMPARAVERWTRQAETPYADLPEDEKDSDRAEADRVIGIAIERAAQVVERWLRSYPTSIFAPPEPGQHGETVDACSAAALRAALPLIAEDIRALTARPEGVINGETD